MAIKLATKYWKILCPICHFFQSLMSGSQDTWRGSVSHRQRDAVHGATGVTDRVHVWALWLRAGREKWDSWKLWEENSPTLIRCLREQLIRQQGICIPDKMKTRREGNKSWLKAKHVFWLLHVYPGSRSISFKGHCLNHPAPASLHSYCFFPLAFVQLMN